MNYDEIKVALAADAEDADAVFRTVRAVAYYFQSPGSDNALAMDLIIRLLERKGEFEQVLKGISAMIDAILREAGLFPFVGSTTDWRDRLAVESMRIPGMEDLVFHIEQAAVFKKLAHGHSIILSAPTSFGKSLLIDALISLKRPSTVVAVVPTIALLDEFRRRMELRFPDYQVITRTSEARVKQLAIFVGTQERLLERALIENIDLFVIDEFYKLDLERSDERSLALNTVLARYGRQAKQIYLLGPSIDEVPNAEAFRDDVEFHRTRYSPVTADIIDRTDKGPSFSQLRKDLEAVGSTSSLIYVKSPSSASKLAGKLLESKLSRRGDFTNQLSKWLKENYHPEWFLAKGVARGFGMHHGRVPRSIAQLMIRLLNQGELAAIICTSSMIEGVNTAAENVFIYDRSISSKKLDRFTFDNIKGRAGRMFKHNIGKVFLYNAPPESEIFEVHVPLFSPEEIMQPELLLQIEDDVLPATARRRKRAIIRSSDLPQEVLGRWAGFGIDRLNSLADVIRTEFAKGGGNLRWKGVPSYDQLAATLEVAWSVLLFNRHLLRSAKQTAHFANKLRKTKYMNAFLSEFVRSRDDQAQPEIDLCLNFIRGAEFTFPQVLRAMSDVTDAVVGAGQADYRVYAAQLQGLFIPGELRALDEYGIPTPLIHRLLEVLPHDDFETARKKVEGLERDVIDKLTDFEAELLRRCVAKQ